MSRLCRLRAKTHGEDGQWAYNEISRLRAELGSKQAEIDRLMLEFYPNEMTIQQVAEWAKNQLPCE